MKQFIAELTSSYEIFLKKSCAEKTNKKKQNRLLSFCSTFPKPFSKDDFSHFFNTSPEVFYSWEKNEEVLAAGNVHSLAARGALRWKELEKQYNDFPEPFLNSAEPQFINLPLFLTAIKFNANKQSDEWSNFKNSEFYIPQFLVKFERHSSFFRFNVFVNDNFSIENSVMEFSSILQTISQSISNKPTEKIIKYNRTDTPSNEKTVWKNRVEIALSEIRKSSVTKVVLARRISLKTRKSFNIEDLLNRLKLKNLNAHVFCIKKNDSIFLGASPEILLELRGNNILTEAIAGSRKRGGTAEEDVYLENELRNSEKEINEHRSVVDFITQELKSFALELHFSDVPKVKKLASIQHLSTEISAALKNNAKIFSVVDKLFPTPAVCGYPKEKAMKLISELEDFDRGLYAGLIGWISPTSAKLVVAIRSALINKNTIFVYAGCGIVEGSDPENEFAETETKFKTILSTLNDKNQ